MAAQEAYGRGLQDESSQEAVLSAQRQVTSRWEVGWARGDGTEKTSRLASPVFFEKKVLLAREVAWPLGSIASHPPGSPLLWGTPSVAPI